MISENPYNYCILRKIIFLQYLPISIGLVDQMGARFDRLRCEVFQNLILSPMNTGFVRTAVATVLTVYGIETHLLLLHLIPLNKLQQYLPFTVLKPNHSGIALENISCCNSTYRLRY